MVEWGGGTMGAGGLCPPSYIVKKCPAVRGLCSGMTLGKSNLFYPK